MNIKSILTPVIVTIVLSVLFAGLAMVPATAQGDTATMQFRYDATHSGDYSAVAGSTQPNGQMKWNYTTGDNVGAPTVVVNGVVYVGSDDNNIYALNAMTGTQVWNYTTGDYVLSGAAVANGVVYVGSWDNNVYALNATTGAFNMELHDQRPSGLLPRRRERSGLRRERRPQRLRPQRHHRGASMELHDRRRGDSSPAVANGVVYVGSYDNNVYALNATTGAQVWSFTTGSKCTPPPPSPTAWSTWGAMTTTSTPSTPPPGRKYGASRPEATCTPPPPSPNGVVYVGSEDHNVYALNATTGAQVWNFTTGGAVDSSPAVANGVVYVGSWDNNVYALNSTTGAKLWSFTTGAPVYPSPAVANGVVYVGSADRNVYAIGDAAGATSQATSEAAPGISQGATSGFEAVLIFVGLIFVGLDNRQVRDEGIRRLAFVF